MPQKCQKIPLSAFCSRQRLFSMYRFNLHFKNFPGRKKKNLFSTASEPVPRPLLSYVSPQYFSSWSNLPPNLMFNLTSDVDCCLTAVWISTVESSPEFFHLLRLVRAPRIRRISPICFQAGVDDTRRPSLTSVITFLL